ncbi:MAG: hypothetical protein R3C27_09300 [Hyphomonadaceae bacterium]
MQILADVILRLFPIAVGVVVFNALMSHIYKLSGGHWRSLAIIYPMPNSHSFAMPSMIRFFEMVEFFEGADDAKGQSWWMIARVYPDGLAISMPPLPGLSYPSIFIPLGDLRVERRPWRSRSDAATIAAPRAPGLTIAVGDKLAAAIEALRQEVTLTRST